MKKTIIYLCLLSLCACGNRSGNDDTGNKPFAIEGNQITVADNSPVLQNIKIQSVETGDYQPAFTTSGVAQAIPSRYAEIASPFAGRIAKSFVKLGQKVSPGSPIFEISSPSFFETGKAYFQAKQEMELALKNLNRERDLLAHKVGVAKDFEEAEVNYELQKKEYENALAAMKVYQIDPDNATLGQPLIVRSPIAGEIVKDNIVIGQYIKEDADALAIVADLDKIWIKANVKEKDIPLISQIADIKINLPALPDTPVAGKIYYTGELLDEETRSVEIIIECENREHRIKPFMYGTVQFVNTPSQAVVVPNSAVLQDEESRYVIVSEGGNRFRKTNVTVASSDEKQTIILSGINGGEQIVAEGAFYFIEAR
jgi:cobalt-zinc-cadmium efflux system membrane fusion protein